MNPKIKIRDLINDIVTASKQETSQLIDSPDGIEPMGLREFLIESKLETIDAIIDTMVFFARH